MRPVKVALSTAALVMSMAATSQPAVLAEPVASSGVTPAQTQPVVSRWYQDPIAITLGLIALFAVGDISLMIASHNQRSRRRNLRRTAQPLT